ncbi:MAG: M28 family peptidase [Candidatus Krumholzibacteriota bacterium]|nr:M28 family peptidase [Candidatus Krumholzibacteriota bacterium]
MRRVLTLLVLVLPAAAAAGPPVFPADEAWSHLEAQVAMGPRHPGADGHARCAAWLATRLGEWGYALEEHRFRVADPHAPSDTLRLVNFRAWLPGSEGPILALAAHWDTQPWAQRDPDPGRRAEPILGANDGASGVAVLLTVARLCAESPPPRRVEFLFFDGEDYGRAGRREGYLLGSRRFVGDHPGYRPELLILLDLVGGRDLRLPMELNSQRAARPQLEALYALAAELGLTAFEARPGREVYDDHVPFLAAGIPAVDLVDLDYPEWDTTADLPAACSPASLAQVGTLLLHYLYE